ncbi:methionine adenosyltransferase [archaeon]
MKNRKKYLFTSESVTEGHPDKMADQISDAILDDLITQDPESHVAVETLLTNGVAVVAGEVRTKGYADVPTIVRKTVKEIGYTRAKYGFDHETCGVMVAIQQQSPDIAQGVDKEDQGAGDQGLMFGYATDETPEYMPLSTVLAQKLCMKLAEVRKDNTIKWMRPDGKSQVTVEYEDGKATRLDAVVIAAQHEPTVEHDQIKADVLEHVIKPICGDLIDDNTKIHVNETGRFVLGGPQADTGLTGRKIIVDTYGGHGSHGGGCFSGKDPSKVDRSASYMARYIAKNIVAAKLAKQCEVQLAYAIGVSEPVSVFVDTFGTSEHTDEQLEAAVRKVFPLRPRQLIEHLKLLRPIFRKTAAYGHFGRDDPDFTWEKADKTDELKKALE